MGAKSPDAFWHLVFCNPAVVWQSVLLPQNDSHPRIPSHFRFIKKSVKNQCFSRIFGRGDGIRAFSGAPRSAIINGILCHQVFCNPAVVWQSVLLPQNDSHPRIPSRFRFIKKSVKNQCFSRIFGRGDGIRTHDLCDPKSCTLDF